MLQVFVRVETVGLRKESVQLRVGVPYSDSVSVDDQVGLGGVSVWDG